jgi:SAM-dependent methyltransferase
MKMEDQARIREDFDRIARLSAQCEEVDRYDNWILRQIPCECSSALDIGCGTGSLTRRLAARASQVMGIDLSPEMVRLARERHGAQKNIEFHSGDFLSFDFRDRRFDCIVAVAVFHHVPWTLAVERAKTLLLEGGILVIMDLVADAGIGDLAQGGVAWTLRALESLGRPRQSELQRAWAEHGCGESYMTMAELRRLCRGVLPGARIRRHLFWRYSIVWRKAA